MKNIVLSLLLFINVSFQIQAQEFEKDAMNKIGILEKLIEKAESQQIDVLKEKTTLTTAKVFLMFANWDENHKAINEELLKKVSIYKNKADKVAKTLPQFERRDVNKILDKSIKEITSVLEGKIIRKPSVKIDWSKARLEGDQITYNNRPVFLSDYILKPNDSILNSFYGNFDRFFVSPSYLTREDGLVKERVIESLQSKTKTNIGLILFDNSRLPNWTVDAYGKEFETTQNILNRYDIDHPGSKKIQKKLITEIVPYSVGKKNSELGYMLSDKPNFNTYKIGDKLPWNSGGVSKYTLQKFKKWLKEKHTTIEKLNTIWGTSFVDFSDVSIEIPIDINLQGGAKWYDWTLFNMHRVTDWYTYLKYRIQKEDPYAKIHLKIESKLWNQNMRTHGIDVEEITKLSGIIGNQTGADYIHNKGKLATWETKYVFNWREMCMFYDFLKSVSPNKINFNTEAHFLSSQNSSDLYLNPNYARASFWLAHTYGMTASRIWYWPRNIDGSVDKRRVGENYIGTNNQQAAVTNEVAMTMIDLNSNAEEIMSMQRLRKPLRIFYSKTSAIHKKNHMDDLYDLYESLNFNGTPIGFATKNIIKNQDAKNWDAILIAKTKFVTQQEFDAIQSYINKGGVVFLDNFSVLKNEYGIPFQTKLNSEAGGQIIKISTLEEFEIETTRFLQNKELLPNVLVSEKNKNGTKGCIWRVVQNKKGINVLSVVNVGNSIATLTLKLKNANTITCKNILTGQKENANIVLNPNDVYFLEITK